MIDPKYQKAEPSAVCREHLFTLAALQRVGSDIRFECSLVDATALPLVRLNIEIDGHQGTALATSDVPIGVVVTMAWSDLIDKQMGIVKHD